MSCASVFPPSESDSQTVQIANFGSKTLAVTRPSSEPDETPGMGNACLLPPGTSMWAAYKQYYTFFEFDEDDLRTTAVALIALPNEETSSLWIDPDNQQYYMSGTWTTVMNSYDPAPTPDDLHDPESLPLTFYSDPLIFPDEPAAIDVEVQDGSGTGAAWAMVAGGVGLILLLIAVAFFIF